MLVCHGVCDNFSKTLKTSHGFGGAKKNYSDGWKRCTICNYIINTTNLRCECCNGIFRIKKRRPHPTPKINIPSNSNL